MGQGQLLTARSAALTLAVFSAFAPAGGIRAQGPLYRERWTDLHLELLRERVLRESAGRDRETLTKVADLLAAPDGGIPFAPAAKALALLRGVDCDAAFLLRAVTSAFVLPEVVDPDIADDGPAADCRALNLTLYLPYTVPVPGKVAFDVEVVDGSGARVFATVVEQPDDVGDLRMGRSTAKVPGDKLADGRYRARVRVLLDGAPPRAADPTLEHAFAVLRGYQRRAEAARRACEAAEGKAKSLERAVLHGLLLEVGRAYNGEAFDGESSAVADLERLEGALRSNADGKAPWAGLRGDVPLALPTGGEAVLGAVVRMPADAAPRPLVVMVGGAPAYDTSARRPGEPAYRTARWVARRLGDLGLSPQCQVAWLQSPAAELRFQDALPQALTALRTLLPNDGRVVLVLEYEAAMASTFAPDVLRSAVGAVLVGAGVFSRPMLEKLDSMRLLGVPMTGHPSGAGVRLAAEIAAGKHGAVDWHGRYELVPDAPRPWTFGAAAAQPEIAAFVRDVLQLPAK
jgi:hypothetical protein